MKHSALLALMVMAVLGVPTYGTVLLDNSFLVGTWVNICPYQTTGSIAAFVIAQDPNGSLYMFTLARGEPLPCLWGWTPCLPHSSDPKGELATGFEAHYDLVWKQTWILSERLPHPLYNVMRVVEISSFNDHWPVSTFVRID
jgi:hypothetical protein